MEITLLTRISREEFIYHSLKDFPFLIQDKKIVEIQIILADRKEEEESHNYEGDWDMEEE